MDLETRNSHLSAKSAHGFFSTGVIESISVATHEIREKGSTIVIAYFLATLRGPIEVKMAPFSD